MKKNIENYIIHKKTTLSQALKKMDELGCKLLIVATNKIHFYSLLSIGDIQRAIIKENNLNQEVQNILRKTIKVAYESDDLEKIKQEMKIRRNEFMPIISEDGQIKDVIFWEELFDQKLITSFEKIDLPIIIMAGGQGTRLKPITNVLPKPLVPLGNITIIEHIMNSFVNMGSHRFYISTNYKAEILEYYLKQLKNSNYIIEFFKEDKPLGTIGSLNLLKGKINETFFISNCDILIDQNYIDILNYHRENKNEITLVAAIKSYSIPYGILHTKENGLLEQIEEKPDLTLKINTGFYIMEPHLINEIPDNHFFHITQLIDKLRTTGRRIGVFPVSEKSWIDIGSWKEYINRAELL